MKYKMYQILNFPPFFDKIKNNKLPFSTSYKLAILSEELDKHIKFYQENYHKLIMQYCQKDEGGRPVIAEDGINILLNPTTEAEAYEKLQELREVEVILPDITFLPKDFEGIELTVVEMRTILPLIKE